VPRSASILALVVIALLVGLVPTAYADPPDPTWFGGYWDDDDFDNTVVFITSALAVVVTASAHARPLSVAAADVESPEPIVRRMLLSPATGPRSPPSRCSARA